MADSRFPRIVVWNAVLIILSVVAFLVSYDWIESLGGVVAGIVILAILVLVRSLSELFRPVLGTIFPQPLRRHRAVAEAKPHDATPPRDVDDPGPAMTPPPPIAFSKPRDTRRVPSMAKSAVTIEVVNSDGKVVTLPPLRPDDKASIRTFIREAEKATGEQLYTTAERGA